MSEADPPRPPHVVFDSVVFVQALISRRGPAAACIDRVKAGAAVLFLSDAVLAEIREVPLRPELTRRYRHLTPERVAAFVADVQASAVHVANPPKAFTLPRDPDDEAFIDLAVAVGAQYLVTWNARHLTYLMSDDVPEAIEFRRLFPNLHIFSPVDFLREIAGPTDRS